MTGAFSPPWRERHFGMPVEVVETADGIQAQFRTRRSPEFVLAGPRSAISKNALWARMELADDNGTDVIRYTRLDLVWPWIFERAELERPQSLDEYAGEYFCEDVPMTLNLEATNDALVWPEPRIQAAAIHFAPTVETEKP